jgi:hypothetical protein
MTTTTTTTIDLSRRKTKTTTTAQRKLQRRALIRASHAKLTKEGVPRRVDGSKLGLRKRVELAKVGQLPDL